MTRYPVTRVFHGHAHHGQPEGRTRTGAPVYNVSIALMREAASTQPFRIVEIDMRRATRLANAEWTRLNGLPDGTNEP